MIIPYIKNNKSDSNTYANTRYYAHTNKQRQGNGSQHSSYDCSVLRHFSTLKKGTIDASPEKQQTELTAPNFFVKPRKIICLCIVISQYHITAVYNLFYLR